MAKMNWWRVEKEGRDLQARKSEVPYPTGFGRASGRKRKRKKAYTKPTILAAKSLPGKQQPDVEVAEYIPPQSLTKKCPRCSAKVRADRLPRHLRKVHKFVVGQVVNAAHKPLPKPTPVSPATFAGGAARVSDEMAALKTRIADLEAQLASKDRMLQSLMDNQPRAVVAPQASK